MLFEKKVDVSCKSQNKINLVFELKFRFVNLYLSPSFDFKFQKYTQHLTKKYCVH